MEESTGSNEVPAGSTNKRKGPTSNFLRFRNRFQNKNLKSGPQHRIVSMPILTADQLSASSVNNQPLSRTTVNKTTIPYAGWQLYFPDIDYHDDLPLIKKIRAFEEHIKSQPIVYKLTEVRSKCWFFLSLQRLSTDDAFNRRYPNFSDDLKLLPVETLACAGLAAHYLIQDIAPVSSYTNPNSSNIVATNTSWTIIHARIQGYGPIIHLSLLKENVYKCLISIRGTVVRVNPPEIKASWIAYRCRNCSTEQAIRQIESHKAIVPSACQEAKCRSRYQFEMLHNSPYTKCEPYQTIRLQENMQAVKGQIPKTIEVDFAHDLVETVYPGDDITVTGIMKVRTFERNKSYKGRGNDAGIHTFFLYGVSVVSNKNTISIRSMNLDDNDIATLKQIRNQPNWFRLLVHSLCPRIFGHDMLKAGLILSLFGGSGNGAERRPGSGKRAEIHVLIVGDPGIGKSVLIQSCANVSPRGIFVCGNSTTNAGLTVSIRHDKDSNGSLEAGALVLADQGTCCIDEFDKMPKNYQSLLQAMEQQTVSVAKAGVLCALPARTSIIAAANPSGGHYDKGRTVSQNLKIWPTILSRFDLVFILLDRADSHLDKLLTEHIRTLNESSHNLVELKTSLIGPPTSFSALTQSKEDYNVPLYERLKIQSRKNNNNTLSTDVLRKYIIYARKVCFPTLSTEASHELYNFYTEIRSTQQGIDSVPVTIRQLEALIRLTQARARLELCDIATVDHARDVLAIFRYTTADILHPDPGPQKINRNVIGPILSHPTKVKRFLKALESQMKNIFTMEELREVAQSMGFEVNLHEIVDSLNFQGFLIKRGSGIYKFSY